MYPLYCFWVDLRQEGIRISVASLDIATSLMDSRINCMSLTVVCGQEDAEPWVCMEALGYLSCMAPAGVSVSVIFELWETKFECSNLVSLKYRWLGRAVSCVILCPTKKKVEKHKV